MRVEQQYFADKLRKFPYIQKNYNSRYISNFEISHPLVRHLISNTSLFEFDLIKIDKMFKKIENKLDIKSIIKESKNPEQFFDSLSEIKVAAILIDKVEFIQKIQRKEHHTPDFKIQIDKEIITIEVKRIKDKLSFLPVDPNYSHEIDDLTTMYNQIETSYEKKEQFEADVPHIFIFDCGFSTVDYLDFTDLLYLKKHELEFNSHTKKIKGPNEKTDRIFHKKNDSGEYIYSNLSGVIGIFDSSMNEKNNRRWVFFRNTYAKKKLQISEKMLEKMEIEQFSIDFEIEE